MRRTILIFFILISELNSFSQTDFNNYIGINLIQLPTSTVNINYSVDIKPYLTPIVDLGYTFNYDKFQNFDLIGTLLTPHIKLYDGYTIDKQSGGYLKIGGFVNLRKDFEKRNFFHFGLFFINSVVYERGLYLSPIDSRPYSYANKIEHTINIFAINISLGYEFRLTERLKTHLDFQLSFPTNKYLDLYSYNNFIPGMGFKDTMDEWFPMLILNLKYRL